MVHKAKWEKMMDDKDLVVYGKTNSPKVVMAEKWQGGWAIYKSKDETPKDFKGTWKFTHKETISNVGTKKEAKEMLKDLMK